MTKTAEKIQNFIDGQLVDPVGGKYLDNIEPATGRPYSQVADKRLQGGRRRPQRTGRVFFCALPI